MDTQLEISRYVKQTALEVGFDACGIAQAEFLAADAAVMERWIADGWHGEMNYLERNHAKRTNPQQLVEGCKSVVVLLLNYFPAKFQNESAPRISKYAYSAVDYHTVIKEKLLDLERKITEKYGEICFNANQQHRFTDSAPVLERRWAQRAGLGWIGKNKMLINPTLGSFCFIGVLMMNIEAAYDAPMNDRCGTCRRCLDACPTTALTEEKGLDARRCISYQTIEKKGEISEAVRERLAGYVYGCDICNDVCPWNKSRAKPHAHAQLRAIDAVLEWKTSDWEALDEMAFKHIFKHSAMNRAGFKKLKKNIGG